jgi:hypothetical protein
LDQRPANPGTISLSSDLPVNHLALNSAYTVLYAPDETRYIPAGGFQFAGIESVD